MDLGSDVVTAGF